MQECQAQIKELWLPRAAPGRCCRVVPIQGTNYRSLTPARRRESRRHCTFRNRTAGQAFQVDRRLASHYARQRTLTDTPAVLRLAVRRTIWDCTVPNASERQPDQNRIVAALASECHLPIGEVAALYEHERAELAMDAHVTKYLHIFATRNALAILHHRELDGHASTP